MDSERAKKFHEEMKQILIENAMRLGISVVTTNLRYSDIGGTFKIEFTEGNIETIKLEPSHENLQRVKAGLAPVGMIGYVRDGGEEFEAIVLKSRRSKYLMAWLDDEGLPTEDKFIINFNGVKL